MMQTQALYLIPLKHKNGSVLAMTAAGHHSGNRYQFLLVWSEKGTDAIRTHWGRKEADMLAYTGRIWKKLARKFAVPPSRAVASSIFNLTPHLITIECDHVRYFDGQNEGEDNAYDNSRTDRVSTGHNDSVQGGNADGSCAGLGFQGNAPGSSVASTDSPPVT